MIPIFLTTIISCQQAVGLVNRLQEVVGLNYNQKVQIMQEIMKVIPNCPVIITSKQK